jgi:hypothetical protein
MPCAKSRRVAETNAAGSFVFGALQRFFCRGGAGMRTPPKGGDGRCVPASAGQGMIIMKTTNSENVDRMGVVPVSGTMVLLIREPMA